MIDRPIVVWDLTGLWEITFMNPSGYQENTFDRITAGNLESVRKTVSKGQATVQDCPSGGKRLNRTHCDTALPPEDNCGR